jgi:hypothetical protein
VDRARASDKRGHPYFGMDTKTERRSPIKEEPLRLPGQGLDERLGHLAWNDGMDLILPAALAWMLFIGSALQLYARSIAVNWILFAMAVALTLRFAIGFHRLVRLVRTCKLGRQGERSVGQALQTIDLPGARVFHDIPADGFNLDHVVVCDRGIFVVETKTWSKGRGETLQVKDGRILMRGRPARGNAVGQAAGNARWLGKMLEEQCGERFECQAVVALPGWFVEPMDEVTKRQAWVLETKALIKWMYKERVKLTGEQVRKVERVIAGYVRGRIGVGAE